MAPKASKGNLDSDELRYALKILADVHTRDDRKVGFVVLGGARPGPELDLDIYAEAWRVVREHLGLKTEPTG